MRRLLLPLIAVLTLAVAPAAQAAATKLTIRGAGFGHGIGMSQFGAYGFALHLKDYSYILGHYYSGTVLGKLDANPEVRVLLQDGRATIKVSGVLSSGSQALDPAKTYVMRRDGANVALREDGADKDLLTSTVALRLDAPVGQPLLLGGTSTPGVRDGRYRGAIVVSASGSKLRAVNAVDLESYVRGVVSAESPSSWPAEALKAQAVAARTYAVTTGGGPNFDQFADVRSQVYRGVAAETPTTDAAVTGTASQVVTFEGKPVTTFFFSTSGGETEDIQNSFVGSTPRPWLKAVEDPFDNLSPKHRWGPIRLTQAQAQKKLKRYVRGRFQRIKVLKRGSSPRVVRAQVVGTKGVVSVTGPQLRAALGLFDTWAYFTTVSSGVKKKSTATTPEKKAPSGDATGATSSDPAASASGGVAAARASRRRGPVLAGQISPAKRGAWMRVQRLDGGRWVTVVDTRIGTGGRYATSVPGPGLYRVAYRGALGPEVRVGR